MRQNLLKREVESQAINAALAYLQPRSATTTTVTGFDSYGGYPLHFPFHRKSKPHIGKLWAQFEEVELGGQKQVVRVVSRRGLDRVGKKNQDPQILIDNRPNIAKELDSSVFVDRELLRQAYIYLLAGCLDVVVTPVRFGALHGFIEDEHHYSHDRWDIQEELNFAQILQEQYIGASIDRNQFWSRLQVPSNLLIPALLHEWAGEYHWNSLSVRSLQPQENVKIHFPSRTLEGTQFIESSGTWEQKLELQNGVSGIVEHCAAYPFLTQDGTVWCRLFRVWDKEKRTYEVIRTVQTQPLNNLQTIPELRIDSNCTNGVHALDGHCDCHLQLREVLASGLKSGRHTMIVQMDDHEGKAHGEVWKGATLYVQRTYNHALKAHGVAPIGNPTASKMLYEATGQQEDLRQYDSASLVMLALGIETVENARTGNMVKLQAMRAAGLRVLSHESVHVEVNGETAVSLQEKFNGGVTGVEYLR